MYHVGEIYTRHRPDYERRMILDISNNIILYRVLDNDNLEGTRAGGGIENIPTDKQLTMKQWNEWTKYATKEL